MEAPLCYRAGVLRRSARAGGNLGNKSMVRPTPIFERNIFADATDGRISQTDIRFLFRHRPRRGWPLSSVTALELLVGIDDVPPERFLQLRKQVELAFYKGRRVGFQPSVIADLVAGPKKEWKHTTERMASDKYPRWRELFQQAGRRLPPEMRQALEPSSA